jgi:guanine nucleotide-binding protein G(i) subunit alpha
MFVSSLGDFDLLCYEDDSTNRMKESMEVFDEIVNGDWFKKTHIFLLFNKIDVFSRKIKTTDLSVAFKDYDGGLDYEKSLKFVTQKFLDLNKFDKSRIHVSTITATDKEDIGKKFEEIANLLISNFKSTKLL